MRPMRVDVDPSADVVSAGVHRRQVLLCRRSRLYPKNKFSFPALFTFPNIHEWFWEDFFITQLTLSCYQHLLRASDGRAGSRLCPSPLLLTRAITDNCQRSPDVTVISDPTLNGLAQRFFDVGETVFDMVQASAVNSRYF